MFAPSRTGRSSRLVILPVLLWSAVSCSRGPLPSELTFEDAGAVAALTRDGSPSRPLFVMLVPTDGGTEDGTLADFRPIFRALEDHSGIHTELRVGQSYNAVVEGLAAEQVDIAFLGAVTYQHAAARNAAELLAVEETEGKSEYFAGIFCRADAGFRSISDLKGKSIAFGDMNSTSSFYYPVAMLLGAGIDPARDCGRIFLGGCHASALQALDAGKVDAACAGFASFEKAVTEGKIHPQQIVLLQQSEAIPSPPLAIRPGLAPDLKQKLRQAIGSIHQQPDVAPDMLRGYGGKRVDRYNTAYSEEQFRAAMQPLAAVTEEVKGAMLRKASEAKR